MVIAGAVVAAGCGGSSGQSSSKNAMATEGQEVFGSRSGKPPTPGPGSGSAAASEAAWSIVIVAYQGDDRDNLARQALQKVRTQGGLPQAYLDTRGNSLVVAFGQYGSADDPEAQADLARIRAMDIEGGRPFAAAVLAPPIALAGGNPEFDLAQVRKRQGDWALYTLQIGFYGLARGDRSRPTAEQHREWRALAEQGATQLRREGEQAFYYHGPNGSAVTIGVFGVEDFDPSVAGESPAIRALRARYPYNLLNGKAVRERIRGLPKDDPKAYRLQPSSLVAIPS